MNQNMLLIILIAGIFVYWRFISKGGGPKIKPVDAKKRLESGNGIILLDVRNYDEYTKSHIPNSILIPLSSLANEAGRRLPDKNTEIIVYCASGGRSSIAVKTLLKQGYTRVYNLGGIVGWPYETTSGTK